jgi:hypothetical protein
MTSSTLVTAVDCEITIRALRAARPSIADRLWLPSPAAQFAVAIDPNLTLHEMPR